MSSSNRERRIDFFLNPDTSDCLKKYYRQDGRTLNDGLQGTLIRYLIVNRRENKDYIFDPFVENTDKDRRRTTVFMNRELHDTIIELSDKTKLPIQKIVEKAIYNILKQK